MSGKKKISLFLSALILLSGCSAKPAEEKAQTDETREKSYQILAADTITVGTQNDDSIETLLKNNTQNTIVSWKICRAGGKFGKNLFKDDLVLPSGQNLKWFYSPSEKNGGTLYDIEIGYENGETAILHDFQFGIISGQGIIQKKGEITYLTYMNKETGQSISTLKMETELAEKAAEEEEDEDQTDVEPDDSDQVDLDEQDEQKTESTPSKNPTVTPTPSPSPSPTPSPTPDPDPEPELVPEEPEEQNPIDPEPAPDEGTNTDPEPSTPPAAETQETQSNNAENG